MYQLVENYNYSILEKELERVNAEHRACQRDYAECEQKRKRDPNLFDQQQNVFRLLQNENAHVHQRLIVATQRIQDLKDTLEAQRERMEEPTRPSFWQRAVRTVRRSPS